MPENRKNNCEDNISPKTVPIYCKLPNCSTNHTLTWHVWACSKHNDRRRISCCNAAHWADRGFLGVPLWLDEEDQYSLEQLARAANVPFNTSEIMFRGLSKQWERPAMGDRATLQPNESVFHIGERNLLQQPNWTLQDLVWQEEEEDSFPSTISR